MKKAQVCKLLSSICLIINGILIPLYFVLIVLGNKNKASTILIAYFIVLIVGLITGSADERRKGE